jgi:hypothetical protein
MQFGSETMAAGSAETLRATYAALNGFVLLLVGSDRRVRRYRRDPGVRHHPNNR